MGVLNRSVPVPPRQAQLSTPGKHLKGIPLKPLINRTPVLQTGPNLNLCVRSLVRSYDPCPVNFGKTFKGFPSQLASSYSRPKNSKPTGCICFQDKSGSLSRNNIFIWPAQYDQIPQKRSVVNPVRNVGFSLVSPQWWSFCGREASCTKRGPSGCCAFPNWQAL